MNNKNKIKKFLPGKRNIKTALSVIICLLTGALITQITGFENIGFFAAIATVFTMESTMNNSHVKGISRIMGTIIGSLTGILFFCIYNLINQIEMQSSINFIIKYSLIFLGVVVVIHLSHLFKYPIGIMAGCVVFISLVTISSDNYIAYIIIRTFETIFGVFVALVINKYLFPHEVE